MEDGIKNYRTEPNPATTLYAVTSVSLSPTQNDSDICCFHIIMMEKLAYICRIISITLTRDALIYKGSGILCVLNLIVLLYHIRTRVPEVIDTIKNWNREQKKKWWLIVTVWWGTQKRERMFQASLCTIAPSFYLHWIRRLPVSDKMMSRHGSEKLPTPTTWLILGVALISGKNQWSYSICLLLFIYFFRPY